MAKRTKKTGNGRVSAFRASAYFFRKTEKDPVIDACRTLQEDTGLKTGEIVGRGGPTWTTISNWFDGPTRRPQYATIRAFIEACGYELVTRKSSRVIVPGKNLPAEAPRVIRG